jgi:hypothetical protein
MRQGTINKIGTENHGFKATTLAPMNQGFASSRLGLHAEQRQSIYINPHHTNEFLQEFEQMHPEMQLDWLRDAFERVVQKNPWE